MKKGFCSFSALLFQPPPAAVISSECVRERERERERKRERKDTLMIRDVRFSFSTTGHFVAA